MTRKKQANELIDALYRAKRRHESITREAAREVADELEIPLAAVLGTATFFSAFNGMDDGFVDDRFLERIPAEGRPEMITGYPCDYSGVKRMLEDKTDMMAWIRRGRLRGRSGSGFPLADKWALTKTAESSVKYLICNGNEGEGDTFKDYYLMVNKPEMILEGMLICALVTGIESGYVYIRAEYSNALKKMEEAIHAARGRGLLGENVLGSGRRLELKAVVGGGAYVSGEETALLEMMEGRRSEPRLKPPYPGVSGLFGRPTIINNAESFAAVAALAKYGPEIFASQGTEETGGTKLITVSGCVNRPGVYELPHHAVLADALFAACGPKAGHFIKGFQVGGGATGSFGTAAQMETVLDYGPMRAADLSLGTGAVRFIGEEESIPQLALACIRFLKDQSCGVCTACRYGLAELNRLLTCLCSGEGTREILDDAIRMCNYVGQDARCALGQAAPTAFVTAYRAFPGEFEDLCKKERSHEYYTL